MGSRRIGVLLLAGLALAWGCNWPMLKVSVAEVPVWQFRAVTGLVAGAVLMAMARVLGQRLHLDRRLWLPLVAAALLNITSWFVLIAYAVKLMGSSHAAILAFTMPLFQAVLSVMLLGETLDRRRIAALIAGVAGIIVLLSHDFDALGTSPLGAALALIGAVNWAFGLTLQKRLAWPIGPVANAGWQVTIGSVPIAVLALVLEDFVYHRASAAAIGAGLYVTFVSLVFAYYAWFAIVRRFAATTAAIGSLLVPVIGVVSSALVFADEPFGWREIVSLLLIAGAVYLVLLPHAAPAARTAAR